MNKCTESFLEYNNLRMTSIFQTEMFSNAEKLRLLLDETIYLTSSKLKKHHQMCLIFCR